MKTKLAIALLLLTSLSAHADQFFGGGGAAPTVVPPVATATPAPTVTPQPTATVVPTATPQSATTVKSLFIAGTAASAIDGTNPRYVALSGANQTVQSSANTWGQFPIAGTLKNMVCGINGSAQTSTKAVAVLLTGTADTTTTCTINSASTCTVLGANYWGTGACCEDTTHTRSVAAGDFYFYKFTPANSPNVGAVFCAIEFDPS